MTLRSPDRIAIDARLALATGDRARARQLAQQALSLDSSNEIAWLVLAALATGERRKAYLEHILSLHPLSRAARAGLESLANHASWVEPSGQGQPEVASQASSTQPISGSIRQVLSGREPADEISRPPSAPALPGTPRSAGASRRSGSSQRHPLGQALERFLGWIAMAAVTLAVIAYLTLFGLTMANRGRNGLPAEPLQAAGAAITQLTQYVFDHPSEYIWHRAETPALNVVASTFISSAGLLLVSLLLAAMIGIPLGVAAATARSRLGSAPLVVLSIVGMSTPSFLLGMLLWILIISIYQRTTVAPLPLTGFGWDLHLVLPALVLAGRPIAQLAQTTYVTVGELLQQDYVRTARGKGLRSGLVLRRHVLRNAVVPILTTLGTSLRFSLASLPVVEVFFGWPGVGSTLLETIASGNDPLVTDLILSLGLFFLLVNVGIELVFPLIDARLRTEVVTEVREEGFSLMGAMRALFAEVVGAAHSIVDWLRPAPRAHRRRAPRPAGWGEARADSPNGMRHIPARRSWMRNLLGNPALMVGGVLVAGVTVLVLAGGALTGATAYTTHNIRVIEGVIQAPPFKPSTLFPWGSDIVGRDVRALVIAGARQTILLALLAMLARVGLGAFLGAAAGWWKGSWFDRLLSGAIGVWAAFPVTLFAMVLIYALGIQQGMSVFIIALCVVGWGEVAQSVRAKVVSLRAEPFIEGARSIGARSWQILWREVLPNLVPSIIVLGVLEMGGVLMLLAELGFINVFLGGGFAAEMAPTGRQAVLYFYSDVPEWGAMLANIRYAWRSYPWLGWYPGVAFFLSILGFNLLGEGIRHLVDDMHFAVTRMVNRYSVVAGVGAVIVLALLLRSATPVGVYRNDALRFEGQRALTDAAALSSPYFQGRETGRPGAKLAAEYIAQRMREVGLTPLVTGETYIQSVVSPRPHVIATPVMQVLAPDGTSLVSLVYRSDFAEYVENAPVYGEFTGPLIGCPAGDWGSASPFESVPFLDRGQIAFVVRQGLENDQLAAEAGGVIIVADDPSDIQRKRLFGYNGFGTPEDFPAAVIVTPQAAERICLAAGATDLTGLSPLRVHIDIPVENESFDEVYYNVIGYLPGSGANTYTNAGIPLNRHVIIISAYYDGMGLAVEGGMYPGANDNASGVATMLEVARLMATTGYAPEKTVIFVAWAGGERGEGLSTVNVLNARAGYADMTLEAVIELSGTGGGTGEGVAIGPGTSFRLTKLIEQAAKRLGVPVTTRGRGPHFALEHAFSFGGRTALSAYLSWDGSDRYAHTVLDSIDKLDLTKMERFGRLVTLIALVLSRENSY